MLLAQAETVAKLVGRASEQSADYGLIGILLVLCLSGVGLALWMFGRFLARRDDLERISREKRDDLFLLELRQQRETFDRQINEQRKQSLDLAKSGQMAVTALSEAFHELAKAIITSEGLMGMPLTQSGIMRRKETKNNKNSVLDE